MVKTETGYWPVLLLDEFLAELDTLRRKHLLDYLQECKQAFLTTTDLRFFDDEFIHNNTIWMVENGQVKLTGRSGQG